MVVIVGAISVLIARELIEGCMFITTHVGAVMRIPSLSAEEKKKYVRTMIIGIVSGLLLGTTVSLAVGYSLKTAISDHEGVDHGVEAGEAVSKLIGALVVSTLTLKLPKWFGLSNYKDNSKQKGIDDAEIESPKVMAMSLFWNILRETIEAGVLSALTIVLAEDGLEYWPESVGVGIAIAVGIGGSLAIAAIYFSTKVIGLLAILISQLLAVGLYTGAAGAFEEIYGDEHDGQTSKVIWDLEDTNEGFTLGGFAFMGLSSEWTELKLSVFIIFHILLASLSIWKHYYGYSYFPQHLGFSFCTTTKPFSIKQPEVGASSCKIEIQKPEPAVV